MEPVFARVYHSPFECVVELPDGHVSAPRLAPALDGASASVGPQRASRLRFLFDSNDCLIGCHGPQELVSNSSWIGGEEQLLLTRLNDGGFIYLFLHRLVYAVDEVEHSCVELDESDQSRWLANELASLPAPGLRLV